MIQCRHFSSFVYNMLLLRLFIVILIYFCINCGSQKLNVKNMKIWGPGLYPDKIVMPARYFFIDSGVDYERIRLNLPIFHVNIYGTNEMNVKCRIWVNILDRKDGSFIVRYKLYETCFNMYLEVTHKFENVDNSPYVIKNPVYPEECNCPKNIKDWLEDYKCKTEYKQIEDDLSNFPVVNFTEIRPKIIKRYNQPSSHSICNYVVKNNEIYRKCYGKYVGFNMFIDSILLSLVRKIKLPDLEIFTNLGDWPLVPSNKELMPIFSWCGSDDSFDIVMPTYDVTESSLENMGRVMLDMLSVQGNIGKTWKEKIPKIFWRGRDSNQRRLDLIDISRKYPDLFNVSLTNFFFFRNEMDKYGPKTELVSFFSFFDYKYQLNMDGTVAAYRFPYLLAGDSLVFKQNSKYYEWFYNLLKPNYHYIEIKEDLSNLVKKIKWAIENDEEAKKIALQGQKFARENLLPQDIFCYYATLLSKWSQGLVSEVEILDGMEEVTQPEVKSKCHCDKIRKDEL